MGLHGPDCEVGEIPEKVSKAVAAALGDAHDVRGRDVRPPPGPVVGRPRRRAGRRLHRRAIADDLAARLVALAATAYAERARSSAARPAAPARARLVPAPPHARLRGLRRPLRRRPPTASASTRPYLGELGVTYLHLMPLLQPRPGPNDGGYAVADYRTVRPDLGTVDDLRALATPLRAHGISLCLDLVLNHVAREHEWAEAGAGRRSDATAGSSTSTPTAPCPTPTSRRCPRCSPTSRRAASRGTTTSTAGSGRRSTRGSGTSTGRTRTWCARTPTSSCSSPTSASRSSGSTPSRSSGSASARRARTSPRSTPSPRRCGR